MKIYVKIIEKPFWDDGRVAVVDNGICNHANADEEITHFDYSCGDPGASHQERLLVCMKCFAWRYASDDMQNGWHDEVILEDKPIKTTAQLVLR